MVDRSPYAPARPSTTIADCYFYHSMDIPGHGLVRGEWDLRMGVNEYLGNVNLKNKRVLEMGSASGYLCFHMERAGAEVVAYDLSEQDKWDIVPYATMDAHSYASTRRNLIRRLNNGWWFAHRAFRSNAKIVYGTIYEVPEEIGLVDVATFGSILLHVRDPFLALQSALRITRETVIITDMPPVGYFARRKIAGWLSAFEGHFPSLRRRMESVHQALGLGIRDELRFLPEAGVAEPKDTWWQLSPEIISRFIGVLGFETASVTFHSQRYQDVDVKLYTVVGRRIAPP
jgi:hypothetical protein